MIYILQGDDDFSKHEFLNGLRSSIGATDLLEANTTVMDGAGLNPGILGQACSVVPFLAERRLVIVEGLLAQFDELPRAGRREARQATVQAALEQWRKAAPAMAGMAPTTILVFLDGKLRRENPLLRALAEVAEVREFSPLAGDALERWARQRVEAGGATITPAALRRLVELAGNNLWTLSGEIEKLVLYTGPKGSVDEEAVDTLVAHAREANIFRTVDAILEGRSSTGLQLVHRLRQDGAEVSYILTMLARQLRLVLLMQELLAQRVPRTEMGSRLGLTAEFALRQVEEQARRHTYQRLAEMYNRLVEADVAIKRGDIDETLALETLVVELGVRPRKSPRPSPDRAGSR